MVYTQSLMKLAHGMLVGMNFVIAFTLLLIKLSVSQVSAAPFLRILVGNILPE